MSSHGRAFPRPLLRVSEKQHWFLVPFMPLANSFIQLVSNFRNVNMKKLRCKQRPIPGCHSKFLVRLTNHLTQVDELSEIERKYLLQFEKLQNTK